VPKVIKPAVVDTSANAANWIITFFNMVSSLFR
jgi:hypothetical protein